MEKVLICFDEKSATEHLKVLSDVLPCLQSLVSKFLSLEVDTSLSEIRTLQAMFLQNNMSEKDIFLKIEQYIKDKLIESSEPLKVGGLKISKEALRDMIESPDKNLLEGLYKDFNVLEGKTQQSRAYIEFNRLEIKDGIVSLKEDTEENIKEIYRTYVTTGKGLSTFNQAKVIADAMNEINELFPNKTDNTLNLIRRVNEKWQVNVSHISSLDKL